jgi:hypothetical protein
MTEQWKKEVDDALAVMGGLQARQARVLADHAEWLDSHQRAMQKHQEWLQAHDRAMKDLDERIGNLVSGLGEFMRRNP